MIRGDVSKLDYDDTLTGWLFGNCLLPRVKALGYDPLIPTEFAF